MQAKRILRQTQEPRLETYTFLTSGITWLRPNDYAGTHEPFVTGISNSTRPTSQVPTFLTSRCSTNSEICVIRPQVTLQASEKEGQTVFGVRTGREGICTLLAIMRPFTASTFSPHSFELVCRDNAGSLMDYRWLYGKTQKACRSYRCALQAILRGTYLTLRSSWRTKDMTRKQVKIAHSTG